MNMSPAAFVGTAAQIGLFLLTLSMVLVLYRIVRGPENADRIIALDLLSVLVVALVALYSIYSREAVFLDVAIAHALVAFLGTVAFARYLERSARNRTDASGTLSKGETHD